MGEMSEEQMDDIRAAAGESIKDHPNLKKLAPKAAPGQEPGEHEAAERRRDALEDKYTNVCKRLHEKNRKLQHTGRRSIQREIRELEREKEDIERKLGI